VKENRSAVRAATKFVTKPRFRQATLVARPDDTEVTVRFKVRRSDAPALRSALDEIRHEVGGRLEGPHLFAKEQALTNAARALAAVAAAVNALAPKGDPAYA
jgi:hypothetical protein